MSPPDKVKTKTKSSSMCIKTSGNGMTKQANKCSNVAIETPKKGEEYFQS